MATVSGHSKAHHQKKGRLREIHVKRAGNGFMVHQVHDAPGDSPYGMPHQEPPAVFQKNKSGAMHKHLRDLTAQMHPPEPTSGEMTGEEPDNQQA